MRFVFVLLLVAVASPVNADIVLRDNLSDSSNWNQNVTLEDTANLLAVGGPGIGGDAVVGLSFTGNGSRLSTIEIIFQFSDNFVPNEGPIENSPWYVGLYLDPSRFSVEGVLGLNPSEAPDYMITLSNPSNSDYLTPVGNVSGSNNYHAIADVSSFDFSTVAGQSHVAFFSPGVPPSNSGFESWLAVSNDLGITIGLGTDSIDRFADNGAPASTLRDRGIPYDNVAARITSVVPEPSSLLLITLSLPALLRRRR